MIKKSKLDLSLLCIFTISLLIYGVAAETSSDKPSNVTESTTTVKTVSPVSSTTTQSSTSTTSSAPTTTSTTLAPQASKPQVVRVQANVPQTLSDFILTMMKKFGPVKAANALESLDSLPLGLIMKILLVEVDKQMASDIVAMQRYAQSADKELIQMIGRIVGGDKNVPKEIFTMDDKLMKYPWWMRIRQRILNNLEKYIAAYSLVPIATKTALSGISSSSPRKVYNSGLETIIAGPKSDLTAAVAASATESYVTARKNIQQAQQHVIDSAPSASSPPAATLKLSLQNPLSQQQQILETLALAQAAGGTNNQVQQQLLNLRQQQQQLQLLQQQRQHQQQQAQATRVNPFLQLFG